MYQALITHKPEYKNITAVLSQYRTSLLYQDCTFWTKTVQTIPGLEILYQKAISDLALAR